jgi:FlaA1/EpsC-like NDP-sugar epimerase
MLGATAAREVRRWIGRLPATRLGQAVKVTLDIGVIVAAPALAILLTLDVMPSATVWVTVLWSMALMVPIKLITYAIVQPYAQSWRAVTFRDYGNLVSMAAAYAVPATFGLLFLGPVLGVPRTVPLLDALLTVSAMAGMRAWARFEHERRGRLAVEPGNRSRVLVIGAGEAGALVARELLRHPETGMEPVGFIDDDAAKLGMRVASVPVLGTLIDVRRVIRERKINEVLIAIPSEGGRTARRVIDLIEDAAPGLKYKIIPAMHEVLSGKVDVRRIRNVDVGDLLGRAPVRLDTEAILGYLKGKRVMITGAGGSIGSELVRQICAFMPAELILFGHGENSIYALERELDRNWPDIRYRGVIGAIQNGDRLDYVFSTYKPDVVFHAAAHKHVPLMEQNPEEAIFNNVIGSRNLISMALKYGVSHFVNISTDKAVNPSSVMGASKRMVEYLVQDAAQRAAPDQVFVSVRFGNVLGSRGSVIPIFTSQIAAGGPVTVTHPDMVRYFMTIPEATQLVLQASGRGRNGHIYILDMGEPVRIVDLARDLIRLSGFEPGVDIDIEFTGMRPGEKLSEMLMTDKERTAGTSHEKIFVANVEPAPHEQLLAIVSELQREAKVSDHAAIRETLQHFLEGCRLSPTDEVASRDAAPNPFIDAREAAQA